jgi:HEAT repeat protein
MKLSTQVLLAQKPTAATLLADIKSGDVTVRTRAVEQSVLVGTPLIVPLGDAMGGKDPAAARAAQEALRRVAHHAARPRALAERRMAARELTKLTSPAFSRAVRVEALYLLGLIGDSANVQALRGLLKDEAVHEEARMALARMPGVKPLPS